MGRRKKTNRPGHPKLFKYLTIFGATIGIVSGTAFSVCMAVDAAKGDLITDEVRDYNVKFSSEGSVISQAVYKRGDPIEVPENPTHEIDGENNYFFIGWDTNKNGIPDFIPPRAYYEIDAEAVYFRTGKFDLNFLDLLNMDLEDLLELLQNLNIDWEQFMSMFNIDPETLMQWLMGQVILTYETNPSNTSLPIYFRSTSYGDFDYGKKAFKAADYYDSSLISDNSVNPLSFTAYKLKKLDDLGALPSEFGFIDFDITFNSEEEFDVVPECEYTFEANQYFNSDAHYLIETEDNKYQTSAVYCPAFGYIIDLFEIIDLPGAVGRDERKYYKYAMEHYTDVPTEYHDVLDDMIIENNWYDDGDYSQVDDIAAYVSNLGTCSLFNDDGSVDVSSYLNSQKKSSDPVMDLIYNEKGSDLDFNTTAVMLFRRLNIPARLVKGYVAAGSSDSDTNSISLFNQHYWCEIYVKGTGWMICDCMDLSAVTGTNPYDQVKQNETSLENKHILDKIVVHQPANTEYYVGDSFNYADGYATAYFKDGKTSRIFFTSQGVTVSGFDSSTVGPVKVTITYEYEGERKSDSFYVTIKDRSNKVVRVDVDVERAKRDYYLDEAFDKSKITATARYQDGTERDFTELLSFSGFDNKTLGYKYVTAGVFNNDTKDLAEDLKSASYEVTVYKKRVDSIRLPDPPMSDLKFYQGEKFAKRDLKYYYVYYDGTEEEGTDADVIGPSDADMSIPGLHDVTIRCYNEKPGDPSEVSTTFQIEVTTNDMLSLTVSGTKSNYKVGESFNTSEFLKNATARVTYRYTDPETIPVSYLEVLAPDLSTAGTKNVTIKYTNSNNDTITTSASISVTAGTIVFNLSYKTGDFYEATYDGNSHAPTSGSIDYSQSTGLESFLTPIFEMVPVYDTDNGDSVNLFQYVPVLVAIDSPAGNVMDQYSWSIGSGGDGVVYAVNPRPITITMTPTVPNVGYVRPNNSFDVNVSITSGSLASGDSLIVSGNSGVLYSVPGDYSDYSMISVSISGPNGDVTGCYDISYVRNEVKVRY